MLWAHPVFWVVPNYMHCWFKFCYRLYCFCLFLYVVIRACNLLGLFCVYILCALSISSFSIKFGYLRKRWRTLVCANPLCICKLNILNGDFSFITLCRMTPDLPLQFWVQLLVHLRKVKTPLSLLQKLGVVRDCLINILTYVSQFLCHLVLGPWPLVASHQGGQCLVGYKICPHQQVRQVLAPWQTQTLVMQIFAPKMSLQIKRHHLDFLNT